MTDDQYECVGTVGSLGLHLRVASEIVRAANDHQSDVSLTYDGNTASCRSILNLLGLAAPRGARVTVVAKGVDAHEAATAICRALLSDVLK